MISKKTNFKEEKLSAKKEFFWFKYPKSVRILGLILVFYLFTAIFIIIAIHINVIKSLSGYPILRTHLMCGSFGMLGAATASIRKYYRKLITEGTEGIDTLSAASINWSIGWIYYYLTRPLLGAILGALSFTFSFIGVHILMGTTEIKFSVEGIFLLYGVSFMSGFAVSHVLDRLEAVARQIFQTNKR